MAKGETTRQSILDVSLDLFSKNGFAGTSVRHIAREVGIRESGIYNHFPSKNDIFREIALKFKSNAVGSTIISDDLIEKLEDPYQFLNNFAKKLILHWNTKNERRFIRLLLMEQYSESSEPIMTLNEYMNEARSMWWMIFDELTKHKLIEEVDPKLLADEFIAPLYMIRIEYMAKDEEGGLDEVLEKVFSHVGFFYDSIRID